MARQTFKGRKKNIRRRLGIAEQFRRKRPTEGIGAATSTFRAGTKTFTALRALRKKGKI